MSKIIAFTGSNSSNSVNEQLLKSATNELTDFDVEHIDLRDYELPIFGVDIEAEGIPANATALAEKLEKAEGYVIATPEHNGSTTAFLKNTMDWLSRINRKYLGENTPVLVLSTSPGPGGANTAAKELAGKFAWVGGEVAATFSLGSFFDNFDSHQVKVKNVEKETEFKQAVNSFRQRFAVSA